MFRIFYVTFAIFIWVLSVWTHEMDIKNQLLKENRTHFLFATDVRVDNVRVIEYITIEKETK